jgi:hypothetical protein
MFFSELHSIVFKVMNTGENSSISSWNDSVRESNGIVKSFLNTAITARLVDVTDRLIGKIKEDERRFVKQSNLQSNSDIQCH